MALYVDIQKKLGDFMLQVKFETDGGVTGILGASGCGKSMTLRCIAGIVTPDAGRIELDGTVFFDAEQKINLTPQKRQVGLLFQNYALFPNMTVRQNLMMGLRSRERDKKKADVLVQEMMERFYLTGLEHHRPCQLSGGQQQRTALARILLSSPRMLMLDEPFSALDDYLKWKLELELSHVLQEFGGSTLFVSHSRDEIYRICNQVCVMDSGQSTPVTSVKHMFETPVSKAAALLSGCKNYSKASLAEEHKVYAEDWGVALAYEGEAPQDIHWIGVRSHYLSLVEEKIGKTRKNAFLCQVVHVIEDVFSMVILVCPVAAANKDRDDRQHTDLIRVEVTKEYWVEFCRQNDVRETVWVYVDPKDVMLLQ